MISFSFKLNKSFLETRGHPITIPTQHIYRLRDDGTLSKSDRPGNKTTALIAAPDGRKYSGVIRYDEAGGNFYYQIILPENAISLFASLKHEECVQVYVASSNRSVQVYLLDSKMSQQIKKLSAFSGAQAEARILEELEKITENWIPFL